MLSVFGQKIPPPRHSKSQKAKHNDEREHGNFSSFSQERLSTRTEAVCLMSATTTYSSEFEERRDEKLMKKFLNFEVQQRNGGETANTRYLHMQSHSLGMESFNYSSHPFNFFLFCSHCYLSSHIIPQTWHDAVLCSLLPR